MTLLSPSFVTKKRIRRSFGSTPDIAKIPDLIHIQKSSYEAFLQSSKTPEERVNKGLESVFRAVFPVSDYENKATVEYVKYNLGTPKYDFDEAIKRGVNYVAPLIVTLRLIIWDISEESEEREIKSIKEQDVYMGEIPLMTDSGTFVINGAQRVVVSQMHRSPGVFYFHDEGKSTATGKYLYFARVIPYHGSWLDFEFDSRDLLFFRIDRKRKLYITTLLMAIGYSRDGILHEFYSYDKYYKRDDKWITKFDIRRFKGNKIEKDIIDADTGDVIITSNTRVTPRVVKEHIGSSKFYFIDESEIVGKYVASPVIDGAENKILDIGGEITQSIFQYISDASWK